MIRALHSLNALLQNSRIGEILTPFQLYSAEQRPSGIDLMECFAQVSLARATLADAELTLLAALGLQPIVEPRWWANLMQVVSRAAIQEEVALEIAGLCSRIQVLQDALPAMIAMLDDNRPALVPGDTSLELMIADSAGRVAPLALLSDAMIATHQIWTVLQELAGRTGSLSLSACDPGSTTLVAVTGPQPAMGELRSVLQAIVETGARFSPDEPELRGAGVARALPLMEQIVRSGRTDAVTLRAVVEDAVRRFLLAGCRLPPQPGGAGAAARPAPAATAAPAAPATRAPARGAARAAAASPALAPVTPPTATDAAQLADLILEERRYLAMPGGPQAGPQDGR